MFPHRRWEAAATYVLTLRDGVKGIWAFLRTQTPCQTDWAVPEGDHEQRHLGASHAEGHDDQEDEEGQQALALTLAGAAGGQRGDDHLVAASDAALVQDARAAAVVLSNEMNTMNMQYL